MTNPLWQRSGPSLLLPSQTVSLCFFIPKLVFIPLSLRLHMRENRTISPFAFFFPVFIFPLNVVCLGCCKTREKQQDHHWPHHRDWPHLGPKVTIKQGTEWQRRNGSIFTRPQPPPPKILNVFPPTLGFSLYFCSVMAVVGYHIVALQFLAQNLSCSIINYSGSVAVNLGYCRTLCACGYLSAIPVPHVLASCYNREVVWPWGQHVKSPQGCSGVKSHMGHSCNKSWPALRFLLQPFLRVTRIGHYPRTIPWTPAEPRRGLRETPAEAF